MPKTKSITVYQFSELSGDAKERAATMLRNLATENFHEDLYDDFVNELTELGIDLNTEDIRFSGFGCQGDGCSFTGKVSNLDLLLPLLGDNYRFKWFALFKESLLIRFERGSSLHVHENTVDTVIRPEHRLIFGNFSDVFDLRLEELREAIDIWREDKCKEFYRRLEQDYFATGSDENLSEFADANDYEFDECGRAV